MTWLLARFGAPLVAKAAVVAVGVLLGLLAASMLANWLLLSSRDAAFERATAAETQLSQARAAAKACSDGVAKVREEEARRRAAVEARLKAADARARQAMNRAQTTLQARPEVAGDACASAVALSRHKLAERARARGAP